VLDLESIPEPLRSTQRPDYARIEQAGLKASRPPEETVYDGWLLRYCKGKAKRARSVNPVAPGERPLDEKLEHCAAFYERHGLPMVLRITPFSQPGGIDAELARLGYTAAEDTRVMVAPLLQAPPESTRSATGSGVSASADSAPRAAMETVDRAAFGAVLVDLHRLDAARAAAEQQRYARSAVDGTYVVARGDDGRAVACGSSVVEGDLVGIFGMVTAADQRGRGLATRIVGELLRRAGARGCTTAYLQVEAGNTPARRAYSKFGFRDGYAYWYRRPPGEGTT